MDITQIFSAPSTIDTILSNGYKQLDHIYTCDHTLFTKRRSMPKLTIWKIIIYEKENVRLEKVSLKTQPASLNSASTLLPRGVYTTMRTYEGSKVLPLASHLGRLETSAELLGHSISIPHEILYKSLWLAIRGYLPGDTRIRITVDLEISPGELFLSLEPLIIPSAQEYAEGILVSACSIQRENPESKQTTFIEKAEQIRRAMPAGAHECLMLDVNGNILEGLSSNFFSVQNGIVRTAPQGILSGITRALVITAAQKNNIQVHMESAHITDIPKFEEAFITSSTRSVLPVRQIDQWTIGKPGAITRQIQATYWDLIRDELVDLRHLSD